jgi:uncharacterized membrane protein YdbT with pleckstrin-like domain
VWYNIQEDRAPEKKRTQTNRQKTRKKQQHANKNEARKKTREKQEKNNRKQQHNLRGILNDTLMCVLYTGTQIRRRIRTSNRSINQSAIIYTLLDEQSRLSDLQNTCAQKPRDL